MGNFFFFFAILCQVPSNGNIWIKASNISWFLGFLFSALPCFLSHLVFKFCIIAHGSNQEEKKEQKSAKFEILEAVTF